MKTLTNGIVALCLVSLGGCGQQLVEFLDLSANDGAGSGDLASADGLGGADGSDGGGDGSQSQAPMVIAVRPLDLEMSVQTFRKPTATFNKAMDPASINTASFTLKEQGATQLLAGSVSYVAADDMAIFKPAGALFVNTTYVATITTAAKDTTGTQLAADFVWTFTTDSKACGMAPVFLGAAGNFGALASTTITNSGPTVVKGDIGVSPGTAIVGFGGVPNGTVIGTQHSADGPAGQAVADLTAASIDAAGRSLCFVTIPSGELGGLTLTPGLYRSGMSFFTITNSDLTLDAQGDSEAVFIIQTSSQQLTVANGRAVILAGGAKASNVFWSVGTQAVIGTTASVKGTILAEALISMNTGATLEGRALSRTAAVTLLSNTISVPTP